ncbi:hypothetical protein OWV82_019594 [Melia azedarach]|uniref:Uncharacterized protein n=1 Tax=Melia azedarach TaxID=155640 RepID=A0ACC1X317_MELAZ|nr:hypothetical protein OWV82_019594 [Melia azedarach]
MNVRVEIDQSSAMSYQICVREVRKTIDGFVASSVGQGEFKAFLVGQDGECPYMKAESVIRSQEQNFEECTAREISLKLRDGANSVSVDLQRGPHSGLEILGIRNIRKLLKSCCALIAKGHIYMKKIFETHGGCRNWMFLPYFFSCTLYGYCFILHSYGQW